MENNIDNQGAAIDAVGWLVKQNFFTPKNVGEVNSEVKRLQDRFPETPVVEVLLTRTGGSVQSNNRQVNIFDLAITKHLEFMNLTLEEMSDHLSFYADKILSSYETKIEDNPSMKPYYKDRIDLIKQFKNQLQPKVTSGPERRG